MQTNIKRFGRAEMTAGQHNMRPTSEAINRLLQRVCTQKPGHKFLGCAKEGNFIREQSIAPCFGFARVRKE